MIKSGIKVSSSVKKGFDSEPVCNKKYLRSNQYKFSWWWNSRRSFLFYLLSLIMIDSVFEIDSVFKFLSPSVFRIIEIDDFDEVISDKE